MVLKNFHSIQNGFAHSSFNHSMLNLSLSKHISLVEPFVNFLLIFRVELVLISADDKISCIFLYLCLGFFGEGAHLPLKVLALNREESQDRGQAIKTIQLTSSIGVKPLEIAEDTFHLFYSLIIFIYHLLLAWLDLLFLLHIRYLIICYTYFYF